MQTETAQDLLEAVGVEWRNDSKLHAWDNGLTSLCHYTGPALGTPELDALLLVAGQRWCVENWHKYDDVNDSLYDGNLEAINAIDAYVFEWLLFYCKTPGHALARAIAEVGKA